MPIYNAEQESVGVAQLVTKRSGLFTKRDEKLFETFAIFCGLGLHASYMYDQVQKSAMRSKVIMLLDARALFPCVPLKHLTRWSTALQRLSSKSSPTTAEHPPRQPRS